MYSYLDGLQNGAYPAPRAFSPRCLTVPQVIQDYVTPPNNTLSRHLMTYLSPQISHLVAARPMSVTMGNAIRQVKLDISGSDIDLPEQDVSFSPIPPLCRTIRTMPPTANPEIRTRLGSRLVENRIVTELASGPARRAQHGLTSL